MGYNFSKAIRGGVVMPLVYSCMGDRRFNLLDDLLARDEWSTQQIQAHQAKQLTWLLRISFEHNPYWREKFKQFGVNPGSSDPFGELAKLPILTKDEVRANYQRMRSTHLPDREVVAETSSGSTGLQIYVWHTRHYRQLHDAIEYRSRAWMGIQPGEPYLSIAGDGAHFSRKKRLLRKMRIMVDNGFIIDGFHIDPKQIKQRLPRAQRHGPVHVHGYPTSVTTVAKLGREMGLEWPTVRAVSTTSEQLLDGDRKLLGEIFDAQVYDRYGSREVLSVAMQCPHGSHHVYADVNYVEFVALEDADDDLHAIVVTPLDNEAMPLFRYRNGDSASPIEGTCSCGRQLPLMTGCRGRICNNFITPDGRIINGTYFLLFFLSQDGFKAYQFHQTTPDHIDLYVVPDGELTPERRNYLEGCCKKIRTDYNSEFNVALHIVEEIPRTPGGKHLYTISDVLKHM